MRFIDLYVTPDLLAQVGIKHRRLRREFDRLFELLPEHVAKAVAALLQAFAIDMFQSGSNL